MKRLSTIAIAALLTLSACGGEDEEPTTSGATGAAGATGIEGATPSSEIATALDYMDASIPDQGEAVQELAEADPDCDGVDTKLGGDFQVQVAINAASATPETSLAEIVNGQCTESWATPELGDKLRAALEPSLNAGEQLQGACVATQVGIFKGRQVAIGVTDPRLIIQGMNRRFEPDGPPISLPPERIAKASAEGAGGGWPEIGAAIMDRAAATLRLRTTDGEKLKLMMMRGTGPLGGLGGGEDQRLGFEALAAWFARHDAAE